MSLGEIIRITRQKAFFTQEEFAQNLNVALSTVNRWELNKVKPNMKAMKAIKAFCDSQNIDFSDIENAWLEYGRRKNDDSK